MTMRSFTALGFRLGRGEVFGPYISMEDAVELSKEFRGTRVYRDERGAFFSSLPQSEYTNKISKRRDQAS